ncbi:MAG: hypothetical protein M3137_15405, partial [Actinomycetota bacterium]|nr:hypothetical protein [Actinomycetota bacterium]
GTTVTWHMRGRVALTSSAFLLLATGSFGVILGAVDSATALRPEYRMFGVGFVLAGLVAASGAASIALSRERADVLAVPAAIASVVVPLTLLVEQSGYTATPLRTVWVLVLLASLGNVAYLWRMKAIGLFAPTATPPPPPVLGPVGPPSERPGALAVLSRAGLSLALLWGFFQFWYTNQFVPAHVGATLSVTTSLKEIGTDAAKSRRVFAASINLKNSTSSNVQVISSLFEATARDVAATEGEPHFPDTLIEQVDGPDVNRLSQHVSRYAAWGPEQQLELGAVTPGGWSFEPGEEYSRQFTVDVPVGKEQQVRLSVDLIVARGQRLIPDGPATKGPTPVAGGPAPATEVERPSSGHVSGAAKADSAAPSALLQDGDVARFSAQEVPLRQLSHIRGLTRGDQSVYVVFSVQRRADRPVDGPSMEVCMGPPGRLAGPPTRPTAICPELRSTAANFSRKLENWYGVAESSTQSEFRVIPPVPEVSSTPAGG